MKQESKISEKILYHLLNKNDRDFLIGDFQEFYHEIKEEKGTLKANLWYWQQIFKSLPHFISNFIYWRITMFKNYIKIAYRNIIKQKTYSLINILGLAFGLAIFTLFAIIAGFDSNADNFHENKDRIFSVVQVLPSSNQGEEHTAFTPAPMMEAMQHEFPEIEKGARAYAPGRMIIKHNENIFFEDKIMFADPNFLSIFSFKMTAGDPNTALSNPNCLIITPKAAYKYFGEENPIGKTMMLDNQLTVTITGIIEEPDENYSSLQFDFLLSLSTCETLVNWMDNWDVNRQVSFLMLTNINSQKTIEAGLPAFMDKYFDKSHESVKNIYLLPLKDFRMKSGHISSLWMTGEFFTQYLLYISGILVLLIVGINFMNLSTARYMSRLKEVGMRKVVGAGRIQLMKQFLSESVIMALMALPISLIIYKYVTTFLIIHIVQHNEVFGLWNHPFMIKYLLGITILIGIISGFYPAFFLSSFNAAPILKGNLNNGKKGTFLRKLLVISQFSLAIILVVFTITIKDQNEHFKKLNYGFDRHQVMSVKITDDARQQLNPIKESLKNNGDIISVTAANAIPIIWQNEMQVIPDGKSKDEAWTVNVYGVDYDFIETMDMTLLSGRAHDVAYNDTNNYVINQTMARQLKWENPLGKQITLEGKTGSVIGVVKDFQFFFANRAIIPSILKLDPNNLSQLMIRFADNKKPSEINEIARQKWAAFLPGLPFESQTLDEFFFQSYKGDRIFFFVFTFVDFVAIFVSCLGLLGLTSYAVEKRTKEIGIRKTLGASVAGIIRLLVKEFMILVVIANIIGVPLAWYLVESLLTYRVQINKISVGPDVLIFTIILTLVTAIIAVSSQTWKAAHANPVESLKYE